MPRRIKSAENGEPTQGFERNRKPSAVKGLNNSNNNNKKSAVQRLYELCVETFSPPGPVASPEAIENLRSFLDTIKPADVGLKEVVSIPDSGNDLVGRANMRKGQCSGSKRAGFGFSPPITYVHVYQCDSFSIGIFCMPPSAVLPLHNHPGMTVLSKLLYGSMHLKSYDCVNPTDVEISCCPPQAKLAKTKVNTIYKAPCESSVLSPTTGGNIHSLTAVTSCAVLDVLAPPYSERDGRHCTYYRAHPCSGLPENGNTQSNDDQNYTWLEEIETPDEFFIRGGKYLGPKIEAR